jgi:hypothetical protein
MLGVPDLAYGLSLSGNCWRALIRTRIVRWLAQRCHDLRQLILDIPPKRGLQSTALVQGEPERRDPDRRVWALDLQPA